MSLIKNKNNLPALSVENAINLCESPDNNKKDILTNYRKDKII